MFLSSFEYTFKVIKGVDIVQAVTLCRTESFRDCFPRYGLPNLLVTDNASMFFKELFFYFLLNNGIKYLACPPYHPATNTITENAVKSFKLAMSRGSKGEDKNHSCLETLINRYLV